MALITSGVSGSTETPITPRGDAMPAVRESVGEEPAKLERVEIRPGHFLKLNARDKAEYFAAQERAAAERARWEKVTAGIDPDATEDAGDPADDDAGPDVKSLKKAELVALAESRGVDATGTKDDLIARLSAAEGEPAGDTADEPDPGA